MTEARPRIVIMPGNNVVADARALKNAATATQLGMETLALGVVRAGDSREFMIGETAVTIVRVSPRISTVGFRPWSRRLRTAASPRYASPGATAAARAYAAHLRRDSNAGFTLRDAQKDPVVAGPQPRNRDSLAHRVRIAFVRVVVGIRSRISPHEYKPNFSPQDQAARARKIAKLTSGVRRVRWRSVYPIALDDEYALLPILEDFDPDLIHVHDVFMMSVATKAAAAAAVRGKTMKIVYDANEYLPGLAHVAPELVAGYVDLERENLRHFDAIVTVSNGLARWLVRDYNLVQTPTVVLNAPAVGPMTDRATIRDDLHLAATVPLAVYAGGVNPERGVETAIDALPLVPGLHFAIVAHASLTMITALKERAARQGVADRFHVLPFVDAEDVVTYLSTATLGMSTLLRAPNHDIALTNKFCEYVQAGLPVVTSDTPEQKQLVEELRIGAVYKAGDAADLARAVVEALANELEIRERLADPELRERFSWTAQAAALRDLYGSLLGGLPAQAYLPGATRISSITPEEARRR